jgi:hypothetical protein
MVKNLQGRLQSIYYSILCFPRYKNTPTSNHVRCVIISDIYINRFGLPFGADMNERTIKKTHRLARLQGEDRGVVALILFS